MGTFSLGYIYHEKIITKELGKKLFDHFINKSNEEKIHIEKLHIRPEHVHILIELPSTKPMDLVARLIKGESSFWVNENKLTSFKFK